VNSAATIPTAQTLAGITAQIQENVLELPAAIQANAQAPSVAQQGVFAVNALLKIDSTASATAGAAGVASTAAAAAKASSTKAATAKGAKAAAAKAKAAAAAKAQSAGKKNARVFIS